MKFLFRFFIFCLLLGIAQAAFAQTLGMRVDRVDIQYVGPTNVSEQFIRSNIRLKAGDNYSPNLTDSDIHSLYDTGQFYNIRVKIDPSSSGGIIVTYVVQGRLVITDVKVEGNKQVSLAKIKKKITVKIGDPLDEQKLFTDVQDIKDLYEKYGYPGTQVKYVFDSMDEAAGRASVTFQIVEAPRIRIAQIEFIGATNFTQRELRKQLKTKQRWMFSWMTHSDRFKEDQFEDDTNALVDFYHNRGFLDFEIESVNFEHPKTNTLNIVFRVFEGRQYKVGSVTFSGNKIYDLATIRAGLKSAHDFQQLKGKLGTNSLPMDVGDVFTPDGLNDDLTTIEDFYGSKGYIDVQRGNTLVANRVPNIDTGTMDLNFQIDAGQKNYVERIDIHGNVKTKDKVIRRELAISPGEVFDMVRVKVSKERLEGLQYFSKVDVEPEPTDPPIPGRKNLEVNVEEQDTGKMTMGAGFSSVDSLVGFAEITQGNFDLFHPPYFTGGGQKLRLLVQLGTQRQDYELEFTEPWFLNRKLALDIDLYRHQLDFESPNNIYNESRTGVRVGLSRDLYESGQGQLRAGIDYTLEDVGITLNSPYHDWITVFNPKGGGYTTVPPNVPQAILNETGDHLYNRVGFSLAYDTRNSVKLPNHGQLTEFTPEISFGDRDYYKLELSSAWYFPGITIPSLAFFNHHVIEVGGRVGSAKGFYGGDVPFYDRYYLGGLYSLRGFQYRNISPRDPDSYPGNPYSIPPEPIGGDSYWFGSIEYSFPIIEKEDGPSLRFAMFYDVGDVGVGSYSFTGNFDDNWGLGLRLDIPHLGPLRLDYGIPIHHDQFNSGSGQFQFDVGYTRPF